MQAAALAMLSTDCLPLLSRAVAAVSTAWVYYYVCPTEYSVHTHKKIAQNCRFPAFEARRDPPSWAGMENPELPPREGKNQHDELGIRPIGRIRIASLIMLNHVLLGPEPLRAVESSTNMIHLPSFFSECRCQSSTSDRAMNHSVCTGQLLHPAGGVVCTSVM